MSILTSPKQNKDPCNAQDALPSKIIGMCDNVQSQSFRDRRSQGAMACENLA